MLIVPHVIHCETLLRFTKYLEDTWGVAYALRAIIAALLEHTEDTHTRLFFDNKNTQRVARLVRAFRAADCGDPAVGAAEGTISDALGEEEGVQTFALASCRPNPRPDQRELPFPLEPPRPPCHGCVILVL